MGPLRARAGGGPGPEDRSGADQRARPDVAGVERGEGLLIDGAPQNGTRTGDALARLAFALARFPEAWVMVVPAIYGALAVASPELAAHGHARAGALVFALFRGLCHQMPSRTIFVAGHPMAVCARCFALAAGLVAGAVVAGRVAELEAPPPLAARRWRAPFWAMCLAAAPMALDGFSQLFGFRESTNTLRVLTGGLLGAAVAFWVVPHLYDAFDEQRRNYFHV